MCRERLKDRWLGLGVEKLVDVFLCVFLFSSRLNDSFASCPQDTPLCDIVNSLKSSLLTVIIRSVLAVIT